MSTISTLLIANRGEIARRIIRTAHAMGIRTVCVYADADVDAPFTKEAGRAFALDGRTAAETYLDVSKLLAIASRAGVDAVHPGYGFLSENAAFAQAVVDAGLVWVGPPPAAVAAMGDKLAAKRIAEEAGVPTLPVYPLDQVPDDAYPVLVKAASGGGGKGMRIVADAAHLPEAVAGAEREALRAFGDGTVFVEPYLAAPRHVEIQILGDQHGNLLHLFERECSIQRRHQKIIEEAPSPAVSSDLRRAMGEAALSLARRIGYHSAGTVEFLVDSSEGVERFFFLEVNTRLQVEHPVTEAITGVDLVREQLRVAMGEPLGYTQADLTINGHAVEARLYAEDPAADFLPATGTIERWEPAPDPALRYDAGVESGSVVGLDFDPMLAKVVSHAPTRREAALALALGLERTVVVGVTTNRDFLVSTLRHPAFLTGDTTTDFITRHDPPRRRAVSGEESERAAIVAALLAATDTQVWPSVPNGWRNSKMPPEERRYRVSGQSEEAVVRYGARRDGSFSVNGKSAVVGPGRVVLDGERLSADVVRAGSHWWVGGLQLEELPRFPDRADGGVAGGLNAPMPGKVVSVRVAAGDTVTGGQLLLILEAMKMEQHVTAPVDGVVRAVHVREGEQVDHGAVLLELDPA